MTHGKEQNLFGVIPLNSVDFLKFIDTYAQMEMEKVGVSWLAKPFLSRLFTWAQSNSVHLLELSNKCCGLELASSAGPRYDTERLGVGHKSSPRQSDLLLVTGPISHKYEPLLLRTYQQMPSPKWVMAIGECAISGGPYRDSYSIHPGVDTLIPVDVYVPGCPVRPEGLIDGIILLQKKIKKDRTKTIETKNELQNIK